LSANWKFCNQKKYLQLSAVILFTVILLASCSKKIDPLPKEIFELKLDKKLSGKEANDFLFRMHSGNVGSDKNEIGFYSGDRGGATIYVSFFEDKIQAQAEEKRMTDEISGGKTEFTNGEVFYIDGHKIYKCSGYSQLHYVFSKENNLYWLTADTEISRKFLTAYYDFLNK
jgi:hypothetical protein